MQLFQFETCFLCAKVRAMLDFKRLTYEKIAVNPVTYREISFSQDWDHLPILLDQGRQINGDTTILAYLEEQYPTPGFPLLPDDAGLAWLDEKFLLLISPNLYGRLTQSIRTFTAQRERIHSRLFRWTGPLLLWISAKRRMKRLGIASPDQARRSLKGSMEEWERLLDGHPFMGGERPRMSDLILFGVVGQIEPLELFAEVRTEKFQAWFERMVALMEKPPATRAVLGLRTGSSEVLDDDRSVDA